MIKVEHMGVSSSQTSEKGNHFHLEESTSEQPNEFRSEHSAKLPESLCEHGQQTVSAKIHEYGSELMHKETSEKNPGSKIVEDKHEEACTLGCDLPAEHSQTFCNDLSKNASTESSGLLPEDLSKDIPADKLSVPQLGSAEPTVSIGSEGANIVIQASNTSLVDPLGLPPGFDSINPSIQQPKLDSEDMSRGSGAELHETTPKNLLNNVIQTSNNSLIDPLGLPPGFDSRNPSIKQPKLDSEDISKDSGAELHETTPKNLLNNVIQTSNNSLVDPSGLPPGFDSRKSSIQQPKLDSEDMSKDSGVELHETTPKNLLNNVNQTSNNSLVDPLGLPPGFDSRNPSLQQPKLDSEDMSKGSGAELHETTPKNLLKNSGRQSGGGTSNKVKKSRMLSSLRSSDRVLRSKSQEKSKATELSNNLVDVGSGKQLHSKSQEKSKATELSNNLGDVGSSKQLRSKSEEKSKASKQQKGGKKKKGEKQELSDEYSKIMRQLRYLLNRINYEQSLIDAYSTEGWKGLSVEKLKPEKELQRATSEILRRKLKIRDLFQHIDSLCAEGRHSESLFDSEGEIDSEDIFCAKCGSMDLSLDNDIILCDGACDRGFHQYCLQPPLLKEDIPPDDEGWLCPGCDCKVDCIELVNEVQGTSYSLDESWEKMFPEAALAAGGQNQDPNFGLPSDDSDDNDYNPDVSENIEKDQVDESSSDESDFTSTSEEELEVPANVDPYSGLPSDDSEDDDYDPDGLNHDNVAKPDCSSSDFSSDSEDLGAMLVEDEGTTCNSASRNSKSQKPKLGGKKSLNDELLSIMETSPGEADATIYEKRSIQRLNYKRLYDETYGNVPSSSSDDEDWNDGTAPRKRKKRNAEVAPATLNGNASLTRSVLVSNGLEQNPEETEHTPRRSTRQKTNDKGTDKSPAELAGDASTPGSSGKHVGSSTSKMPPTPGSSGKKAGSSTSKMPRTPGSSGKKAGSLTSKMPRTPGSSGKKAGSSTYKRLGEGVTQGLYESFKQNQYLDRSTKESLANGLGITVRQVTKWFENARWCFNHSKFIPGSSKEEPK